MSWPQNRIIWVLEESMILTALRRLCGHALTGPSGVVAQLRARMRSPISPPPASQSKRRVAGGIDVLLAGAGARVFRVLDRWMVFKEVTRCPPQPAVRSKIDCRALHQNPQRLCPPSFLPPCVQW